MTSPSNGGGNVVGVENEGHAAARKEVEKAVQDIRTTIKALDTDVHNLDGWEGSARGGLNQAAADWGQKATKLNAVLNDIAEKLNKADSQLTTADHHALPKMTTLH